MASSWSGCRSRIRCSPTGVRYQRLRADADLPIMRRGGDRERGGGALGSKWFVAALGARGSYPSPIDNRGQPRAGRAIPRDDECIRKPLGGCAVGLRLSGNQPLHRFPNTARGALAAGRPAADVLRQRGALRGATNGADARPRYQLTEKGRAFFPVIITALQCGQHRFHAPEGPAVMITHLGCGEPFTGELTCDQCAQPLKGTQVSVGERDRPPVATTPTPTPSTAPRRRRPHHRHTGRRKPIPAA
jgi:hypothetical protein